MSGVIINGSAIPGDGDTDIEFSYGDCDLDVFDLAQLVELSATEDCQHRVLVWDMNSEQKLRFEATGIAFVIYQIDRDVTRLYMLEDIIDGPFLFMLAVGDKFKAFHCENCAQEFIDWFVKSQTRWKGKFHASLSQSTPTPKKSYQ